MRRLACLSMTIVVASCAVAQDTLNVDPRLPTYERARGVDGSVKSIGSDTLNQAMGYWAELFKRFYPNVTVEIEGKGSSTAPPALIEGQAQLGPMSRKMKQAEVDAFEAKFNYKPSPVTVGIDALAVFVHRDCPLDEITLDQIRAVFSVDSPELTWGDLGVTDPRYRTRRISLYGRNSASGTYGFFKKVAMSKIDYKASVKEQPGSAAVVQGVARDPFSIGYSGIGYLTADVKALRVAEPGMPAASPTFENAISGDYPLARFLYVYINLDRRTGLDPLREEFIRLILSRQGQESLIRAGYFPLPAELAKQQAEGLGMNYALTKEEE